MSRWRLTLPSRFGTEARANAWIRDNSLWGIGCQAIELPPEGTRRRFAVIVDTADRNTDAVQRWLSQRLPGITWQRSELAP